MKIWLRAGLIIATISALFVLILVSQQRVMLLKWYAVIAAITFFIYAIDKTAAHHARWRVPENTLHALAVIGGWPGAILAQQILRHKSVKPPFRLIFWLTVTVNLVGVWWFAVYA